MDGSVQMQRMTIFLIRTMPVVLGDGANKAIPKTVEREMEFHDLLASEMREWEE